MDTARLTYHPEPAPHRLAGVPLDLRRPTAQRFHDRWWNAQDPRVFVPKVWGWGWDLNLRAIPARLRRGRRGRRSRGHTDA